MPNWKKVIVSGSDAILNSITSSAGISSSGDIYASNFIGSASYANNVRVQGLDNFGYFRVIFTNDSSLYRDSNTENFNYNPSTNTLVVQNIIGTASIATTSSFAESSISASFAISAINAISASYSNSSSYSELANSINIDNDFNNRLITANGDKTLNAESNLNFNGNLLSINADISQGRVGRSLISNTDNGGSNNLFQVGDIESNRRSTVFEVRDSSGSFYFFTENNDPHYLNSSSLFISGNISSSGLYVDNRSYSPAEFTGIIKAPGLIVGGIEVLSITGSWLSNNGNNRVITSNGNGTFTAESNLTFNTGVLAVAGNINVSGNADVGGNLIVQGDVIAENYIVSSSVTYMTQSFSSGSTIFGDSMNDTHLFTGSVEVTGSLTVNGIIYPIIDGLDRQVIKTDGNGNLTFGYTENTQIAVKNVSGNTIQKGTPCFITESGTSGNIAGIIPADAGNPAKMPASIIAGETLINEAEGLGLLNGFIQGVDTSQFESGDIVYVAVGGGYTNVKPTGSALIQKLGNVEKSGANGSGVINGPGYYNEVPNITEGHTWVGNSDGVAIVVSTSSFGDNLGNHTATQDLDMAGNNISDILNITASGNISASGNIYANSLVLNITSSNYISENPYIVSLLPNERSKEGYIERIFDLNGLNPGDAEYGLTDKELFSISNVNNISIDYSITVYGGNVLNNGVYTSTNDTASILVIGQFFNTSNPTSSTPVNFVPISYNYPSTFHLNTFNTFYNQGRGYIIHDYNSNSFKINNTNIENINSYTSGSLVILNINYKATK